MNRASYRRSLAVGLTWVTVPFFLPHLAVAGPDQASFQGLGDLQGGSFSSHARAVSPDGSVVVGNSVSELGPEAFIWTSADGMQGLGDLLGGGFSSNATGVSTNGTIIVGTCTDNTNRVVACRWTSSGVVSLNGPNATSSTANDVSADGTVAVGTRTFGTGGTDSIRWVSTQAATLDLGTVARGVSGDGSVAVGDGWSGNAFEPIRWVVGFAGEGLDGANGGEAIAASSDGSIIVGWTSFLSRQSAFRWLAFRLPDERMELLSDPLNIWTESRALDISADGSVIVGEGKTSVTTGTHAFIWDVTNGMRRLEDVLQDDFCLDLSGWLAIPRAAGASADGLTIVGYGTRPGGTSEGWIARITPLDETDLDDDGTPNCADGCPADANKIEPGLCGCGISDDDSDNDETPDCFDGCPDDPNKIEPGVCGCGVPGDDIDSDLDGVVDCVDNCPQSHNMDQADDDNDSTGNVCDGCPNDPNKIEPGLCDCGISDDDSDNDETPDCFDGCPDDPNKIEPGVCGCGVPGDDIDSDLDGVPDCNDLCPGTQPDVSVDDEGCQTSGACCFVNEICLPNLSANDCVTISGWHLGEGTWCDGDPDRDGAVGCDDGCPFDMLKTEPGQCGCGFADNDLDNDTVADCHDNCLNTPNPNQTDSDGDNFGDTCDGCPNDPNKIESGVCGCGIADVDGDEDGVEDCNDGCPQDPDKIEPGICGCGVPEVLIDTDDDGVFDCLDLCPDTAPGILVDEDGCPTSGACCFAAGVCAISTNAGDCAAVNGTFQGIETICDDGCAFPGTGDYNGDLVINLDDFTHWPECMKGPSVMHPANRCFAFDFDGDGDVDNLDWAQFQLDFLAK